VPSPRRAPHGAAPGAWSQFRARRGPLQNRAHIGCRTSVIRRTAHAIEEERTLFYPPPYSGGHHRQPALGRDGQDPVALRIEQGKGRHEQGLGTRARHRRQDGVQRAGTVHVQQRARDPQGRRRLPYLADDGRRHRRVVYLSPTANSAGSVWPCPRDVNRTVMTSSIEFPRPGAGRWPCP
jgi:hypothetical protein